MESQVFSKILRVIENEFLIPFNYEEYLKKDNLTITFPEFSETIRNIFKCMFIIDLYVLKNTNFIMKDVFDFFLDNMDASTSQSSWFFKNCCGLLLYTSLPFSYSYHGDSMAFHKDDRHPYIVGVIGNIIYYFEVNDVKSPLEINFLPINDAATIISVVSVHKTFYFLDQVGTVWKWDVNKEGSKPKKFDDIAIPIIAMAGYKNDLYLVGEDGSLWHSEIGWKDGSIWKSNWGGDNWISDNNECGWGDSWADSSIENCAWEKYDETDQETDKALSKTTNTKQLENFIDVMDVFCDKNYYGGKIVILCKNGKIYYFQENFNDQLPEEFWLRSNVISATTEKLYFLLDNGDVIRAGHYSIIAKNVHRIKYYQHFLVYLTFSGKLIQYFPIDDEHVQVAVDCDVRDYLLLKNGNILILDTDLNFHYQSIPDLTQLTLSQEFPYRPMKKSAKK